MPTAIPFRLTPDLVRFITSGISINTGSGSPEGVSSQCRAFGCRVNADGSITVFLAAPPAATLLHDVGTSRALAVVFSDPPTHRTLQFKGWDARAEPLEADDPQRVAAYRTAFVQCLLPLGFTEATVRALLDCADGDLVALTFTLEAAFNQTPEAQAGAPLMAEA